eukprot:250858_1
MYLENNLGAVLIGLGLNQSIEAEARDRVRIELPGDQVQLAQFIYNWTSAQSPRVPIICILIHGGAVAMQSAFEECDAIMSAWYPGQMGAYAIADVLFGYVNPSIYRHSIYKRLDNKICLHRSISLNDIVEVDENS